MHRCSYGLVNFNYSPLVFNFSNHSLRYLIMLIFPTGIDFVGLFIKKKNVNSVLPFSSNKLTNGNFFLFKLCPHPNHFYRLKLKSSASKVAPQARKPNPCSCLSHQTPTPTSTQAPTRCLALTKINFVLPQLK